METERAPGRRALMTRGPAGSAVRSNIAGMVQEGRPAPAEEGRAAPAKEGRPLLPVEDAPGPQGVR